MFAAPLFALLLATTASAQQASNFNVTLATAESYQCGEACYEVLQSANAADLAIVGSDFDWDFYTVADNFSTSKPGDLLKFKPVDPTSLTAISGVSVYRIQYVSEDLDGTHVPVTGYIALPESLPDSGKFPLVAFAHGTVGGYRGCAISNGPNLFDYNSWSLLSERGYALVGTDYAGLGLNTTAHKYCSFPAHAKDLFHSVTAARHAFGSVLSDNWMSVGHSQGGGAVWKLAENIDGLAKAYNSREASNYLGAVAISPATKIWDLAQLAAKTIYTRSDFHDYSITSLVPLFDMGIKRVYPSYNSSILGPVMASRMGLADEAQLCTYGLLALTLDLDFADLTTLSTTGPSTEDKLIIEQFQNAMAPASGVKARGPILVVQGVNDTAILAQITEQAWESACASGSEVHLTLYPKQDHSGVITAAAPDWLKWVDQRFAGHSTNGQCSKATKKAFDYENLRAQLEMDPSEI